MPKVSVIIPAYNNFESFKKAYCSVLNQLFQDYEIVVTDDSSNDDIAKFIDSVKLPKVKYFKNPQKLGAPENWNEGIRKASGEYIKILHHDDWFSTRESLGKLVKLMDENPECDFGYLKSVDVVVKSGKEKHRKAQKYLDLIKNNPLLLLNNNRIGAPSVTIFRRNLDLYFDPKLKWLVDVDFYIRAIMKNCNVAFLNEELINIGIQDDRLTDFCNKIRDLEKIEKSYILNKLDLKTIEA